MIKDFYQYSPDIAQTAFVDDSAVVIGDVIIGDKASIWPMCVVRGDIQQIQIGARTNIQDGTVIHVTHSGPFNEGGFATIIGDDVIIGHKAMLHGCTIESNSLIGMNATVMDGAHVSSHCMIAAGALVPPGMKTESGFLYVGNPAKKKRALTEKELAFLSYSANYYVELAAKHKASQESQC